MNNTEVKFDVNQIVKVKLTNLGIAELKRQHEAFYDQVLPPEFVAPSVDEDGYSRFQLWSLMQTFGSSLRMGLREQVFETEIILLIDSKELS